MPYVLEDLKVNRVDLVDEGANSAAFVELYKRKEQSAMELREIVSKLKPEHATVIQEAIDTANEELRKSKEDLTNVTNERDQANTDLAKAKADLEAVTAERDNAVQELEVLKAKDHCECGGEVGEDGTCKECGKVVKADKFDETETLKSMPQAAREMFEKMKTQKELAESELLKAKDAEKTAEAVAKAKELKAIPVEQEKLVGIIKNASPELLDLLTVVNTAIEGTVLDEVGKNNTSGSGADAWTKIEAKADEIVKRDSVTKAKAISIAIKENPDLYKEYLQGGAK